MLVIKPSIKLSRHEIACAQKLDCDTLVQACLSSAFTLLQFQRRIVADTSSNLQFVPQGSSSSLVLFLVLYFVTRKFCGKPQRLLVSAIFIEFTIPAFLKHWSSHLQVEPTFWCQPNETADLVLFFLRSAGLDTFTPGYSFVFSSNNSLGCPLSHSTLRGI
jgi:hypothetical protein